MFLQKDMMLFSFLDTRLDGWPLMDNPLWTAAICLCYIYFAKVLGPKLMEKRPAFELREMMMVYNAFQVLFHILLLWEVGRCGWFTGKFSYLCEPVDFSNDPSALRIMRAGYMFFISKYVDMIDTVFFVLRKKSNQISFLHVTHHGLVPFLCYPMTRFVPGGNTVVGAIFNSLEHVLMYFYYLVTAMGPRFQWFLKWKKKITAFQISQFVIVSLHSFRLLFVECGYPIVFTYWIVIWEVFFLFLFINFYTKTYKPKKKTEAVEINANYATSKNNNDYLKSDDVTRKRK